MIKILYVCNTPLLGGASKTLMSLLRHISRSEIIPTVVVPAEGPVLHALQELSIKCEIIPIPHWFRPVEDLNLRLGAGITEPVDIERQETTAFLAQCQQRMEQRLQALLRIISENAIDFVQTTGISILEGAIAARLAGKRHIWHIHEYLSPHPGLSPFLPLGPTMWLIDHLTDRVVVPSAALKKAYESLIARDKLCQVYNGVETVEGGDLLSAARQQFRSRMIGEFNIPSTDHVICSVGHHGPEKGWPDLVRTAHLLQEKRKDFRIIVVGNYSPLAENFRELERSAKELQVANRIIFAGFRKDVQHVIAASDIVFQPSRMETFSLVAAEAMAMSVPVVGTRCGGMEEVIVHGETGFVTDPGDSCAMAESLRILMEDPSKREEMGRRGRLVFLDRFSPARYAEAFTSMYRELVNNQTPGGSLDNEIPRDAYSALAGLCCSTYSVGLQAQLLRKAVDGSWNPQDSGRLLAKSLLDLAFRRIRSFSARHFARK
jgi:glycosyltransferase involved in cell wall biosynthesis